MEKNGFNDSKKVGSGSTFTPVQFTFMNMLKD